MKKFPTLQAFFRSTFFHPAVLAVLSAITHFAFFGYPSHVVFDEVYFGKFAGEYLKGTFFFDQHPPLGKLLLAGMEYLSRIESHQAYAHIGEQYLTPEFLWLRFLPVLAGTLLPIVIYYLCRSLSFSKIAAFSAGLLVIFENSLLVQSRFILIDSMLLLFGFSGLLFYFLWKQKRSWWLLVVSSICLTAALSVKWSGASFFGLVGLLEAWEFFHAPGKARFLFSRALIFIAVPVAMYVSIFAIHFSLLTHSGDGDAFMTVGFQKTLAGSSYEKRTDITADSGVQKFFDLNKEMYDANKNLTATHPYGSKWYTWPLMLRPIYYWNQAGTNGSEAKIYLLGNPIIYLASFISLFFFAFSFVYQWRRMKAKIFPASVLAIGYISNLVPFAFITRVMFLYHYSVALVFAILILVFMIDSIESPVQKKNLFVGLVVLSAAFFLFFAPFSYGLPLTVHQQDIRFWLGSWR